MKFLSFLLDLYALTLFVKKHSPKIVMFIAILICTDIFRALAYGSTFEVPVLATIYTTGFLGILMILESTKETNPKRAWIKMFGGFYVLMMMGLCLAMIPG